MTIHRILSILLTATGLISTLFVAWLMWRTYIRRLPKRMRAHIEHVVLGITGYDEPSLDNIRIISDAFRKAAHAPLTNLWTACVRSFKELGDGRIFVDLDEEFDADRALEGPLRRRNASHIQTWLLLFGLFWCLLILAIGFMTLENTNRDLLVTTGCAILQLAVSVLLSFLLRFSDNREYVSTRMAFNHMVERIRDSLPPYGRDDLIHNLYVLQQSQSHLMRQNVQTMQDSIERCLTETMARQIESRFREAIQKHFTPSLQKMADTHEYVLKAMQESQQKSQERVLDQFASHVGEKLKEQFDAMAGQVAIAGSGMQHITEGLADVSAMMQAEVEGNRQIQERNHSLLLEIGGLHSELMKHMMQLTGQLENLSQASNTLAESSRQVNEKTLEMADRSLVVNTEMNQNLQRLFEHVDENLKHIGGTLESSLGQLNRDVGTSLEWMTQAIDGRMGALVEANRTELQAMNAFLGDGLTGMNRELATGFATLDQRMDGIGERLSRDLSASLSTVDQDMTASLTALEQRLSAALTELSTVTDRAVHALAEQTASALEGVRQTTADHLEGVRLTTGEQLGAVSARLGGLDGSIGASLTTLEQTVGDRLGQLETVLAGTLDGLNTHFDSLNRQLDGSLGRIAASTSLTLDHLAGTMAGEAGRIAETTRQALNSLTDAMTGEAESIAAASERMEKAMQQSTIAIEESFSRTVVSVGSEISRSVECMSRTSEEGVAAVRDATFRSMEAMEKGVEKALVSMDSTYARGAEQIMNALSSRFTEILSRMADETESMQRNAQSAFEEASRVGVRMAEQYRTDTEHLLVEVQRMNLALNAEMKESSMALLGLMERQGRDTAEMFDRNTQAVSASAAAQIQALKDESSGLLNVLPEQMRTAFETFAGTMSDMLTRSMADSSALLAELERRTSALHAEYDNWFTDSERNTDKLLGDLRFALESVMDQFAGISRENVILMNETSRNASEAFNGRVSDMLATLDEQNRTITLYLKDLGIDLGELNQSLKESVTIFHQEVDRTVGSTFEAFDANMAEAVERLGVLSTHIEESVSALPETLRRLGGLD